MTSETVESLHAVTSELKACNTERDEWLRHYDAAPEDAGLLPGETVPEKDVLEVTRSEAEMIFTARRTAIEAKLKDLGWSKTTRVESPTPGVSA